MKETFNIIMIYTLTLCSVTAQNLLKNGDFEIGNDANLENDCFHQDFFNNNRVFFWESEYSNKKWVLGQIQLWPKDCGKTDPPANCDLCARHSPDWFNDASYYINNTLGPIMNLGSNHIAGLGGYELLQQKLDNTLDNNTKYLLVLIAKK